MGLFTLSQRRRLRRILLGFGVFVVIGLVLRASLLSPYDSSPQSSPPKESPSFIPDISLALPPPKVLVVASMKKDDTTWIQKYLPDWTLVRYVVDRPTAQYAVPLNKGREAMVYLT